MSKKSHKIQKQIDSLKLELDTFKEDTICEVQSLASRISNNELQKAFDEAAQSGTEYVKTPADGFCRGPLGAGIPAGPPVADDNLHNPIRKSVSIESSYGFVGYIKITEGYDGNISIEVPYLDKTVETHVQLKDMFKALESLM